MTVTVTDHELRAIRDVLPAVQHIAYLNAGTLGPLPTAAIDAMQHERSYDEQVRQDAGHWDRLHAVQVRARDAVSALVGVRREQVALMHSTHEGLNACLWGLELRSGDNIVTTDEEHPGLLVPLKHVSERLACEVRTAGWAGDDGEFVAAVLALVDARTRAVALSHVSWVSGRLAPLRLLADALPAGVRLIVDGAQSAGVLETDPSDGWDAYTVSGQKWPCGPNGSGGLALVDPEAWTPTFGAYMQVDRWDDLAQARVVSDGRRLETSQEALIPLAGFAASVEWLVEQVGLQRACQRARQLNDVARRQLEAGGIDLSRLHGHDHLLCIDVAAGSAPSIAAKLFDDGYLIRPLGEDRLRMSFGVWNTQDEVARCVAALLEHP